MQIKFKSLSFWDSEHVTTDCKVIVEGIGEQTMAIDLPAGLKDAIAAFCVATYRERLAAALSEPATGKEQDHA